MQIRFGQVGKITGDGTTYAEEIAAMAAGSFVREKEAAAEKAAADNKPVSTTEVDGKGAFIDIKA